MSETRRCPQCSAELPPDAPQGVCPKCLLELGLSSKPGAQPEETTPWGSRRVPPTPEQLAEHFPQLEIIELIGSGGMGAVYKARQPGLDRLVALKILPPEVGQDPTFTERFTREARALARLSHPHIVTVHDSGEAGGYYYFVMEFVEGVNVRQMIQTEKLQPQEALAIVPQICEALQYAHDEGIIHRDIKPENVLVDKEGRVKIADFGLAKLLGRAAADFTLTGTGQVMGTAHYMAPEQMDRPLQVDHRADIYSLGVVFYEMLTGELPIGRFAPPSKKVQVDVRLDEVVLRALENEPDRRYQSIGEVKTDLESLGRSPAQSQALTSQLAWPYPRHRLLFVFATEAFMVIFAVGAPFLLPHWGISPILTWVLAVVLLIVLSAVLAIRCRGTPLGVYAKFSAIVLAVMAFAALVFARWVSNVAPQAAFELLYGIRGVEASPSDVTAMRNLLNVSMLIVVVFFFGGCAIWRWMHAHRRKQ